MSSNNMPHVANTEDAMASIEVMRLQEATGYNTESYLSEAAQQQTQAGPNQPVDAECRSKMAEWCYQVVDFCKFNRETVAITMSFLDRYLMTPVGKAALTDRKIFQLAAMTCLYTAIKIHEPEAMEPKIVASLSRGTYTEDQVTEMEREILMAIQWRMNPPTAMSFVHHFMELMPENSMTQADKTAAIELAKFQTELAVTSYKYVGDCPSTIAFAALSNALQCSDITPFSEYDFLTTVANVAQIDGESDKVVDIQDKLYFAVETTTTGKSRFNLKAKTVSKNMGSSSSIHYSPRSVSAS